MIAVGTWGRQKYPVSVTCSLWQELVHHCKVPICSFADRCIKKDTPLLKRGCHTASPLIYMQTCTLFVCLVISLCDGAFCRATTVRVQCLSRVFHPEIILCGSYKIPVSKGMQRQTDSQLPTDTCSHPFAKVLQKPVLTTMKK